MNLISVIVPVYNLEQYLGRCLDSLFAQTHRELEVIAVDDGSTDSSPKILDEYAQREPRLKVIHKPNGGVSSARNAGLAAATGDFIGFCDGDDIVEPGMYERLLANLLKYDADISHCGMCIEGLDGEKRYFYNTGELCVQNHAEGLLELLKGSKVEPTLCLKLYKKSLFKDVVLDSSLLYNEDLLANAMLFKKAEKSVYEDICLYKYMRRLDSACKGDVAEKHVFHPIEVRSRIIELCKNEEESIQRQAKENYIHSAISTYSLLCTERAKAFVKYKDMFRRKLSEHKDWLRFLPKSTKLHALLIIDLPLLYKPTISLYRLCSRSKSYG